MDPGASTESGTEEMNETITILIEWILPDGQSYIQKYIDIIKDEGEQATVRAVINQLTSIERMSGESIRSVEAVATSKMDRYHFKKIVQPLYDITGYEVAK